MDVLELTLAIICLGLTTLGFLRNQPLLLIMAGLSWLALGFLMGDLAPNDAMETAFIFIGVGLSLVCFIWPLTIWLKGRDRLSPEERDYEDYKRKVQDTIYRR